MTCLADPKRRPVMHVRRVEGERTKADSYTPLQGQYSTFIYYYTKPNGLPPAERDIERYFRSSPPAVHQMVLALEKKGFIARMPFEARSIRLLLPRDCNRAGTQDGPMKMPALSNQRTQWTQLPLPTR